MSMSNSMPSRPTLLMTPALTGYAEEPQTAPAPTEIAVANSRDGTTPAFYALLCLIMMSLVCGLFLSL